MLVQVAPGNARSCDPENPIQDKAVIPRSPPAARAALNHERLKTGPFLITHQTTDQGSFPKSYLESEPTRFGNPLCQHVLGARALGPRAPITVCVGAGPRRCVRWRGCWFESRFAAGADWGRGGLPPPSNISQYGRRCWSSSPKKVWGARGGNPLASSTFLF